MPPPEFHKPELAHLSESVVSDSRWTGAPSSILLLASATLFRNGNLAKKNGGGVPSTERKRMYGGEESAHHSL